MLIEIDAKSYKNYFPNNPHPFINEQFIDKNNSKVEKVVRLVDQNNKISIGLVAGVKDLVLKSPFSAPFGGFHFTHEEISTFEIDNFIDSLKSFVIGNGLKTIELSLPPDIYHPSFNAKMVNALLRNNFIMAIPEITSLVDLQQLTEDFYDYSTKNKYNKAVRNGLSFSAISNIEEKRTAYEIIVENRVRNGRSIYMTFDDLNETGKLWPIDYFRVDDIEEKMVAAAVFYRNHPKIIYATFWGDSQYGRALCAMDFLIYKLWEYYKNLGYKYIDLSISTEKGMPNDGLLRFKEIHHATSSLRHSFTWNS